MKGSEFREIRLSFGLKKPDWMYALGYSGNKNTMFLNCERYENGSRPIPLYLAQYVWLLHELGRDGRVPIGEGGLPMFPIWPAYQIEGDRQP